MTLCVLWILSSFFIVCLCADIGNEAAYAEYLIRDQNHWEFKHTLSSGKIDTHKDGLLDSLSTLIKYDHERRVAGKSIVWIILGISTIGYVHSKKNEKKGNIEQAGPGYPPQGVGSPDP